MTTRAQREALRTDGRVREQLPTLADALDRLHSHEKAQASFVQWWAFVTMNYAPEALSDLRALPGFDTLREWMQDAREEEPPAVEGRTQTFDLDDP